MKLVYIFQSMAKTAGTERILTDKMNYFAEQPGYEVYLITSEQGGHPTPFPLSDKITHIDIDVRFFTLYRYGKIRRILLSAQLERLYQKRLGQKIAEIQPDIICCTTYAPHEIKAITRLKDKSVKIIESHIEKTSNEKQKHFSNPILRFLAWQYDRQVYKNIGRFDVLVALTQGDAASWKNMKQTVVIPNIITKYPPEIANKQETRQVITVGRLAPQKGYDLLIESWKSVYKKHPDWVLNIYGKGEDREMLLSKIQGNGLEKVVQIKEPTPEIYKRYMESDFYVMSSRCEGFGLVLLEAMSCGIPCVSFRCPHGPEDIIKDNIDGLLVDNGDVQQLAGKICFLIEHADIRHEMGAKARENVKCYLPENIMPQWEALFKTLINK